jgi:hypothetical protein
MTNKSTLIALVAALAVTTGGLGLSLTGVFDGLSTTQQESSNWVTSNTANGLMMGHLTVEAHNEVGDLTAYRQSDNAVVDDGEQCILKMLFGGGANTGAYTSTGACTGSLTKGWDVIAIGTNTADAADEQVVLGNETSSVYGLERKHATTKTWSNGTGTDLTQVVLAKTFTNGAQAHTITESGLFNSTTVAGSGMLARQSFTGVALSTGDSITITWTFTVGN